MIRPCSAWSRVGRQRGHFSSSWWLAGLILLAAVLWMVSGSLGKPDAAPLSAPAQGESAPFVVSARWFTDEPMSSELMLTGHTQAERRVSVKAETVGTIVEVLVERGSTVDKGQIILRFALAEREARLLEARSAHEAARIRYEASRSLKQQGYQAVIELGQAKAALDAAEAAVRMATLERERVDVRAPFAGVINERRVEVGDYVDRGQALAQLVDLDPIRVVAQVSERHLGQIHLGAAATIRTLDGARYEGQLSYVGRVADVITRTIPLEVRTPNPDGRLIEGITAELSVPMEQRRAHRVPSSVLHLADDGSLGVKAVDDAGIVNFHPVRILGGSGDALWVGDLPARLRLITSGQAFVQDGQEVAIVQDEQFAP